MKRVFLSGLVLIFLLNLVGWQWILIHKQTRHREKNWSSIKSAQNKASKDLISISNKNGTDVCFINSHEILFHGRLYDVISIKKTNSEVIYYCLADNEEEQIVASFDHVVKSNLLHTISIHSKNMKMVRTLLDNYLAVSPIHFIESNNSIFVSLFSSFKVKEPFIDLALLPPEVS